MQIETLNRLRNSDITFGELVVAVFPDALEHIPDEALRFLHATKVKWPTTAATSISMEATPTPAATTSQPLGILVGNESNIALRHQAIGYDSGSRVWLPHPVFTLPYMSVLSPLERQGVGVVASQFKFGQNKFGISASGSLPNPPLGNYRTVGYHAGTFPPNYQPPGYSSVTITSWQEIR